MSYESSLTSSVNDYVNAVLTKKIAMANRSRDIVAAARSVRQYLEDPQTLITPDFVIRRHIQAEHPDLLPKGMAIPDLIHGNNVPWDDRICDHIATLLFKSQGELLGISKKDWKGYLTDKGCGKREKLFKVAFALRMDVETTLDLMLALGMEPYNPRNPMDFICLFCQKQPGRFTWQDAQGMLNAFRETVGKRSETPKTVTPGMTEELTGGLEDIFESYLADTQSKQALVSYMIENAGEFSDTGYSHTRMEGFLKLSKALEILYPIYYVPQNDGVDVYARELPRDEEGYPTFRSLAKAMFQQNEWEDLRWSREEEAGNLFKFWNNYEKHMMGIDRLRGGGKNPQFLNRRDALVFLYFFISGYHGLKRRCIREEDANWAESYTPEGQNAEKRLPTPARRLQALEELYTQEDSFGFSYCYALRRLERVFQNPLDGETIAREFERLTRAVDALLTEFGYQPLYLPAEFDRFVALSLLSGHPEEFTPLLLSKLELTEQEEAC